MSFNVVIGIPTLNGPDRLDRCLRSIEQCTKSLDGVRVLVCDDASSSENLKLNKDMIHQRERLRNEAGLEMIMSETRSGIAASWNKLTKHHDARLCVLLNDDVEVVDKWLDVLVWTLDNNPRIGMVGLNAYLALIKEQHARAFPYSAPHERIPMVDYNEAKLLDGGGSLISAQGSAFAFRRADFDAVGGFDERYFVYYEEVDFAVSLRAKANLYSFMASYPVVFHQGGATNSDPKNLDAQEHMRRSKALFEEKWGGSVNDLREKYWREYTRPNVREWSTQVGNWR